MGKLNGILVDSKDRRMSLSEEEIFEMCSEFRRKDFIMLSLNQGGEDGTDYDFILSDLMNNKLLIRTKSGVPNEILSFLRTSNIVLIDEMEYKVLLKDGIDVNAVLILESFTDVTGLYEPSVIGTISYVKCTKSIVDIVKNATEEYFRKTDKLKQEIKESLI